MKEECKVYIKGVQGRGDEVIKTLTDLGAKNYVAFDGENTHAVYFITHDGNVGMTPCGNEIEEMLMEYCHEVKLPEKQWKDGDILVDDDNPNRFIVKSNAWNGGWKNNFKAYLFVTPKSIQESPIAIFCGAEYHKADLKEIRRFHKFLHMHGRDWDAENKILVDWKWKPKDGDTVYYFDEIGQILSDRFDDFSNGPLLDFGNCFQTKEEAEAAAERVRKVLKGE